MFIVSNFESPTKYCIQIISSYYIHNEYKIIKNKKNITFLVNIKRNTRIILEPSIWKNSQLFLNTITISTTLNFICLFIIIYTYIKQNVYIGWYRHTLVSFCPSDILVVISFLRVLDTLRNILYFCVTTFCQ